MIAAAKDSLLAAQERQAKYADRHRRDDRFYVGEQVLLSTVHFSPPTEKQRPLKKLQPTFIGPSTIIKVISPTACELDLPDTLRVHPVFHISLLKRYKSSPPEFP